MIPQEKATILVEALPYIRRWSGKTVVIKVGGEILDDPSGLDSFATDISLLSAVGIHPIVVHGGGRQISSLMQRLGKVPEFVDGQRVTDQETMDVVKMVMLGRVNSALVSAINSKGVMAAGISGEDGGLLSAEPISEKLGFVGKISAVSPSLLQTLSEDDYVPVVAPIAAGPGGSFNINADVAAAAIASELDAAKVVFLTNVSGLYRDLADEGSLISEVTCSQLARLLDEGIVSEGMIPKVSSAVEAIEGGVRQAHILDGRLTHALLLEIFTDEGVGTMVIP